MKSYIAEIDELLQGETPKEKFEWLKELISENARAKGRIDYCENQFKIVQIQCDPYTKGYIEHILSVLQTKI